MNVVCNTYHTFSHISFVYICTLRISNRLEVESNFVTSFGRLDI